MGSGEAVDFSEIRGALGSIGLSAIIVFGGTVLSQAMGFGTRIVMTNFLPVDGYGEVVLGITVLNFLGIVSIIGLGQAMNRYLPRADSKEERTSIATAIYQIGIVLSIFWSISGFLAADIIAGVVFSRPNMAGVIRIFALSLPFYVIFKLSLNGIQGHKETAPNILTKNLVLPATRLGAVSVLAFAGYGLLGLAIGFNVGFLVAGIVGFTLFLRAGSYRIRSLLTFADADRYRELLAFSLPLAVTASIGIITKQSDILLLGILGTSEQVGIYDVVFLTSQFLLFFSPALNYLFQPIMSEYHAKEDYARMDQLYIVITRWLVILSFPIFALLTLVPEPTLGTFFGSGYRTGGFALTILAAAYFATRLVGLSGSFLTATGETNALMYISTATSILNIGLNLVLIPFYGIIGAAVATSCARILNNALQSIYIYRKTRIHPFERELLLPTALIVLCLIGTELFISERSTLAFGTGFVVAAALSMIYVVFILVTRSVYLVELQLLDALLNQIGVRLNLTNRLAMLTR